MSSLAQPLEPVRAMPGPRPIWFLLVYALANAGGVIGFLPLLTLLLPMKIEAIAGDARISVLTTTVIAGAIAASLSNILFGWLSDRSVAAGRGRRQWVAAGLVGTAVSYAAIAAATTPTTIVLAVVFFQAALNAMLGPLVAVMADEIPDEQKGLTSGLLSLAYPAASGMLAAVVGLELASEGARFAIVVAVISSCMIPLVLTRAHPLPIVAEAGQTRETVKMHRLDLAAAWLARLLFQVSGVILQLYLLYYFESIVPELAPASLATRVGHLLTVAFIVPLPIALLVGRVSDRLDRRKPFLLVAAMVAAAGLLGMALARDWTMGAFAFGCYAIGYGVFLPLQAAFSMQLLPDPQHRGRDLGILNLTNTLPSLLGPLLTWALATPRDFGAVMMTLVGLTFCGGLVMLGVRGRR